MNLVEIYEKASKVIHSCETLDQCVMADAFRRAASYQMLELKDGGTVQAIKALRRQLDAKQKALQQEETA